MVEPLETSLTREVRFAMGAYLGAREAWKTYYEGLTREMKIRQGHDRFTDTDDEREMYRHARQITNASTRRGTAMSDEVIRMAWRYVTEVSRLSIALGNLRQHLENLERWGQHLEEAQE